MIRKLSAKDYCKDAVTLAPLLLGKYLCRQMGKKTVKLQITETEAYYGTKDTACHAHRGKTPRNSIMFEDGGYAYIYLCYGVHWLFNIVSGKTGFPEAVLIRGIEGFDGPGKLTKYLQIDKYLNGENLMQSKSLWIEDHGIEAAYRTAKRVGINSASIKDQNRLWRFLIK